MKSAEFERRFVSSEVTFDPRSGYPRGDHFFYQCRLCTDVIPSVPEDNGGCSCGNLFIDVDHFRLATRGGDRSVRLLSAAARSDRT